MNDNLIQTLLNQHIILRKEMANIKDESEKDLPAGAVIIEYISKFKTELVDHLNLENSVFYPKLLEQMKKQDLDITDTVKFIDKMKIIEKKVDGSLEKYSDAMSIEKNLANFKFDLNDMISTLMIRIDAEERGPYLYWRE